LTGGS